MHIKFLTACLFSCTVFASGNSQRFTLAGANLSGCQDFVWEIECDALIQIWYLDGGPINEWQFYQPTTMVPNNNNPLYATIFTIPSDAKEFKFVVIDDDSGVDDVLGYATATVQEITTGVGGITVKPISFGEGNGFVHITLRP